MKVSMNSYRNIIKLWHLRYCCWIVSWQGNYKTEKKHYAKVSKLFLNGHRKYFQIHDQYVNMDSVTTLSWVMKAQKPWNKIPTTCVHTESTLKRLKHVEGESEVTRLRIDPEKGGEGERGEERCIHLKGVGCWLCGSSTFHTNVRTGIVKGKTNTKSWW